MPLGKSSHGVKLLPTFIVMNSVEKKNTHSRNVDCTRAQPLISVKDI